MKFVYSRRTTAFKDKMLERFLEILPGAASWTIIIGICLLSVFQPLLAAVIMIAFLFYWLLRMIYLNIFLVVSYLRLSLEKNTDWMERIRDIDALHTADAPLSKDAGGKNSGNRLSAHMHYCQMTGLKKSGRFPPLSRDIHHLVIIPVIRETINVVEPGIKAIKEGNYPSRRFLIVIALEETASDEVKQDMHKIKDKYRKDFLDFLITVHPAGLPGEARVKGANTTFAARHAEEYFKKHGIAAENVLVSCFDADTVANPDYFGCLSYYYMVNPDRLRLSYQPVPVYHNNIWEAPAFARIIDIGTSFFQLIESTNPKKLVTFSSHSMSFKALRDIGYWPVDMISDDSAIFWKAFIHYQGAYRVAPIYTVVSMDIATGPTLRKTFISIYKQKMRWAWGVENFPIVIRAFLASKGIGWRRKISYAYKLLDSFISWSTWSFLLLFGTSLPAFFASREFASSTIYYTAPRIRGIMFSMASVGLFVCMIISLLLLPRTRTRYSFLIKIGHALEWLFIPFILLFLSALPALHAQTRLMLGRYMEFWVTDKFRKSKKLS